MSSPGILTNQSLDQSLAALAYSNNQLSETMSAVREMIRENHLVQLPKKAVLPINNYYEFEGILINGNYYLVNYDARITNLSYSWPEYEIEIVLISMCPAEEIQGEYKPIYEVDKTTYEQILTAVHNEFENRHLQDLIESEMELQFEKEQGIE